MVLSTILNMSDTEFVQDYAICGLRFARRVGIHHTMVGHAVICKEVV